MAAKLRARKIPVPRWTRTLDNLHVIVRNTGEISFHGIYTLPNGKRTSMLLGEHPDMTIDRAQPIVKTLQALADKGIDPQSGLHRRLVRELETQGDKWRTH